MTSKPPTPLFMPALLPQWQYEYEAVLHETDHKMLFKRVEVAEAALLNRLDTLRHGPNGKVEREEVEKALDRVRAVKKNVLNYPL